MKIELSNNVDISNLKPIAQLDRIQKDFENVKIKIFKIKSFFSGEKVNINQEMVKLAEEINNLKQSAHTLERMYYSDEEIIYNNKLHIKKIKMG